MLSGKHLQQKRISKPSNELEKCNDRHACNLQIFLTRYVVAVNLIGFRNEFPVDLMNAWDQRGKDFP